MQIVQIVQRTVLRKKINQKPIDIRLKFYQRNRYLDKIHTPIEAKKIIQEVKKNPSICKLNETNRKNKKLTT